MIPFEMRDFINVMSLVIFGGILLTAFLTLFAYLFAIDRRKAAKKLFPEEDESEPMRSSQPTGRLDPSPPPATPHQPLNRW